MLNLITSALRDTEAHLTRFFALILERTNLSEQEIQQIWNDAASATVIPSPPSPLPPPSSPIAEEQQPPSPPSPPIAENPPVVVSQPPPVVVSQPPPVVGKKVEVVDDDDIPVVKSGSLRCRHIMVAGKSKGQPCGAPAKENGYCNKHKTSSSGVSPSGVVEPKVEAPKSKPKEPTPSKEEPPIEFVKLTVREEENKIEFRMKKREMLLDHKDYPPVPTCVYKTFTLVEETRVVLNEEETAVLGYLDAKDQLVRTPTAETDKIVLKYGLGFDTSHISEDEIDD
jgi:hypothetical protein